MNTNIQTLSLGELSHESGLPLATIKKWVDDGELHTVNVGTKDDKDVRVLKTDFETFWRSRGEK